MKRLFGLVAMLITVGIILYVLSIQLRVFQKQSVYKTGSNVEVGGGVGMTETDSILTPIDRAEKARRALEIKSQISGDLIQ